MHSPTTYFPLIVPEALMIEPTETETLENLEAYAKVLNNIALSSESDKDKVVDSPKNTSIGRLDEYRASHPASMILNWNKLPRTEPEGFYCLSARSRKIHESLKQKRRRIASQQIEKALNIAVNVSEKNPQLSENSARYAWRLSTKFNVRLGHYRLLFCRACKEFMVPLTGSRFRLSQKNRHVITITCLKCGYVYRKPF